MLGLSNPMLLRPTNSGQHTVVGQCHIRGLDDSTSLLGPLPEPWTVQMYRDGPMSSREVMYLNGDTGVETAEDPRLGTLPEGWKRVEHHQRRQEDPAIFSVFLNCDTGETMNSDPRLSPEYLSAKGVQLEMLELI